MLARSATCTSHPDNVKRNITSWRCRRADVGYASVRRWREQARWRKHLRPPRRLADGRDIRATIMFRVATFMQLECRAQRRRAPTLPLRFGANRLSADARLPSRRTRNRQIYGELALFRYGQLNWRNRSPRPCPGEGVVYRRNPANGTRAISRKRARSRGMKPFLRARVALQCF